MQPASRSIDGGAALRDCPRQRTPAATCRSRRSRRARIVEVGPMTPRIISASAGSARRPSLAPAPAALRVERPAGHRRQVGGRLDRRSRRRRYGRAPARRSRRTRPRRRGRRRGGAPRAAARRARARRPRGDGRLDVGDRRDQRRGRALAAPRDQLARRAGAHDRLRVLLGGDPVVGEVERDLGSHPRPPSAASISASIPASGSSSSSTSTSST